MEIPITVILEGWMPFLAVIAVTFAFSVYYVRKYRSKYDGECISTIVAALGLAFSFMTAFIVPFDVFVVSSLKNSNGTFQDWATNETIDGLIETVQNAYYVMYSLSFIFIFVIIPFVYFYHEEREDVDTQRRHHLLTACKFTAVVVALAGVLLLLGAFIPLKKPPKQNTTEWEKFEYIIDELGSDGGVEIMSFILSILSILGMIIFIIYTGTGFACLPLGMIKGMKSAHREQMMVSDRKYLLQAQLATLRDKYRNGQAMSRRDRMISEDIDEEIRLMERQEHHLQETVGNFWYRCHRFLRPLEILLGLIGCVLGFLIFLSLLLTNVDRLLNSLGPESGYVLVEPKLPNVVDLVLTYSQTVYPVDYIIFTAIILFFVLASIRGVVILGIRFLWIKLYKIRPKRTRPQALLLMIVTLMLIMLAMNIVIYSLVPQYSMYGNQHYLNTTFSPTTGEPQDELVPCNINAPEGVCLMTRMGVLLTSYFYKAWIFGVAYYWMSWFFLVSVIIGSLVMFFTKQESTIQVDRDDFEDSDDDILTV